MKNLLFVVLLSVSVIAMAKTKGTGSNTHEVKVKEHKTKKGTVVKEHYRSAPNHSKKDNWDTSGNLNPRTKKRAH